MHLPAFNLKKIYQGLSRVCEILSPQAIAGGDQVSRPDGEQMPIVDKRGV